MACSIVRCVQRLQKRERWSYCCPFNWRPRYSAVDDGHSRSSPLARNALSTIKIIIRHLWSILSNFALHQI